MDDDEEVALSVGSSSGKNAGSGAQSLAGYDYQVDVSIWLALDLMLGSSLTQLVELEPGTEEDIEAQLADDEPGRVVTRVALNGYTLVVQVKLRSGDAWTVKGIVSLLKHGSATRLSAAKRLAQPTIRYLLVTSAALNGKTRDLAVKHAGSWPKESGTPVSIVNALPAGAAGRVAVIGNLDEERLVIEIKRLLIERFGVPNSRWAECLRILRDEAWLRVRHVGGGRWRREDLAEVIRNHDGYLASSPELDDYVHPRNWQDLRDAMGSPKYAAIIIGQSGTGKTLATRKLYEELRQEIPGLTRVPISYGPEQLRDDQTPAPVLYDIEDPWGRYNFDPNSRPWNDQLADYLSKARADRMVIATSRKDVARESGAMKSAEPWIVPLEAENYGKPERQRLYRSRIKTLPRDIQVLAADSERQVLDKLATPLEIEKFFDALRTMGRPKRNQDRSFIRNAIAKAHEKSIENTVVQQIESRDDVRAAAVIWAFLKASDHLSLQALRDLELELVIRLPALRGVTPLIDFFVAARNLRAGAGDVSYYHPRVEAGVESALKRQAITVVLMLRALLDVLTDLKAEEGTWGTGVAARIVAAAKRIPELILKLPPKTAAKIDTWLSEQLIDPSCNLNEYLKLAEAAGSPSCNGAEFARYILHRPDRGFGGFVIWGCPDHPDAWYKRLRADPAIAIIAERFVREVLPDDRTHYGESFIVDLDRLAPDLTPAYLQAAENIVRYGFIESAEIVAAGGVRDLDGFEPIVDSAVKEFITTSEQQTRATEIRLAITNEVYNDDYAEHLAENDEGYTAAEFLRAYVNRVREERGWMSLAMHRHSATLRSYWMRSLINGTKEDPPSNDEMDGAFDAAFGTEEEDALWTVLGRHWDDQYRVRLVSRISVGSSLDNVRYSALECFILKMPDELSLIVDKLRQAGKNERVVELMIDLAHIKARWRVDRDKHEADTMPALKCLDPVLQELCDSVCKGSKEQQRPLSSDALMLLDKPAPTSPSVRKLRISRHIELSASIRYDIEWTLAYSDDRDACVGAIDAAISLDFEDIVEDSLNHKFAHVVAKALTSVGEKVLEPLPANLLALAEAKGSPVRKALVRLLAAKPHRDHLPVLLRLAQDKWSSSSRNYGEDDNFPIARAAVSAIGGLASLEPVILEQLQDIAIKTSDWLVREESFEIIAEQGHCAFQERLFELAVTPGRMEVSVAAAHSMLVKAEVLDPAVVGMITSELLVTHAPSIAARLTLIVACRASLAERQEIARGVSESRKRRALLLLMLWPAVGPCESSKLAIEQLLPDDHSSLAWVAAGPTELAEDDLIADLGEPAICQEILQWMNPKKEKS